MNKLFKVFGIIALAAVIGFSMTACDEYDYDLANWTAVPDNTVWDSYAYYDIIHRAQINTIVYGNGKFVAGGNWGKMATSADGVTWTAVEEHTFDSSDINAIVYGNNIFVAVGGGKMAISADGTTWTAVDVSKLFNETAGDDMKRYEKFSCNAIAYGNNTFVGLGVNEYSHYYSEYESRTIAYATMVYSTDGVTWTAIEGKPFGTRDYTSHSGKNVITYGNGKFVAIEGDKSRLTTSADGITWTTFVDITDYYYGHTIAYGNGKYVVDMADGIAYSTDCTKWTKVELDIFEQHVSYFAAIIYGNGKFVAGGGNYRSGSNMATSTDGVTWAIVEDSKIDDYIYAIAYGNGMYVAGGRDGKMSYCKAN